MDKLKIPVQISVVKGADGREHRIPTMPLNDVLYEERSASYKDELALFGRQYQELLTSCEEVLAAIQMEKKILKRANPLLFWALGDRIVAFLSRSEKGPFYLSNLYLHLSRDLSISASSLTKIVAFRRKFWKLLDVDDNKSWDFYRNQPKNPL